MAHRIHVLPQNRYLEAPDGANLLQVLRHAGLAPDAPCGGDGRCGKCKVILDGEAVLSCRTQVTRDLEITLTAPEARNMLTDGFALADAFPAGRRGPVLAFDLGTTTVAGYLLDGKTGQTFTSLSAANPQASFGADVVSRIRHGLNGQMEALTGCIRDCIGQMSAALCQKAGVALEQVETVCIVGNPAMQQLFLGIRPENLVQIPFAPVLTKAETVAAGAYLPGLAQADLLIVPDISGYVGADTVACVLATGLDRREKMTLLVDIGTNGEMVLGNRHGMVATSTAAGPALEGANIRFGMGGRPGAIDHVYLEHGAIRCSVIGGGEAVGICGSGLIDAVAVALELGWLNERGEVGTDDGCIHLTSKVCLNQEDIRQVQLAKGAIACGIRLLAKQLGICLDQVERVYLAGAFGTFMDPVSACRIGLLPPELEDKITAIGNAAGSGAKQMACSQEAFLHSQTLCDRIGHVELSQLPEFAKTFAKEMRFALPKEAK